jgi:heme O synthase-like polyprenyltransferase
MNHRPRQDHPLALRKFDDAVWALPRFQLPAQSRVTTRVPDFMALMTRVMLLAVFTALVGLMIAPGDLDPFSGSIAILTIAAGAGAAVCSTCGTTPISMP